MTGAVAEKLGRTTVESQISAGLAWLDARQTEEGYWVGQLESNSTMEAEWLLAFHFLGIDHPKKPGLVQALLSKQRPDGAWEVYRDAPGGDINSTVECYAALRSMGMAASTAPLEKARQWIFSNGGLRQIRVFTRYWLALIGEWPWGDTPNCPPEIILTPKWFALNIYNFSASARAIMVPLSILSARRPAMPLLPSCRLDELFPDGRDNQDYSLPRREGSDFWSNIFRLLDRCLHRFQRIGFTPGRETAIRMAREWILKHQEADGVFGAIQPCWIYSLMALVIEGFPLAHPSLQKAISAMDGHWSYEKNGATFMQATESTVWDTLWTLTAMQACGRAFDNGMRRAVEWILRQQIRSAGDWAERVKGVESGAWAFARASNFFPDVDDTALALIVLTRSRKDYQDRRRLDEAVSLAQGWLLAMQCRNGGWAAFDKDNGRKMLASIPFCDFGDVLDPPSVDVTAHAVEALAVVGMQVTDAPIARALAYIRNQQESSGSWFGRWGVNHIYGTAAVLPALAAVGEDMGSVYVRRAGRWFADHQNTDGGWGESCASYMDLEQIGKGQSTASQTAWALIGLLALKSSEFYPVIREGINYLLRIQHGGRWEERFYTGTGCPGYRVGKRQDLSLAGPQRCFLQGPELQRGIMLKYEYYPQYFSLLALARARAKDLLPDALGVEFQNTAA